MQTSHLSSHLQTQVPIHQSSLSRLMQIYELNYILLKKILDDCGFNVARSVYYWDKQHCIEVVPLEYERYTTTILLTYSLLDHQARRLIDPVQLKIRIYHDACQAELFHFSGCLYDNSSATGKSPTQGTFNGKWIFNKFLNNILLLFNEKKIQAKASNKGEKHNESKN